MDTLRIKRIDHPEAVSPNEVERLLKKAHAEWHTLRQAPWANDYPYQPEASFAIAHTGSELLIAWRVDEDCVRAEAAEDGGRVWQDSCCELFLQPDGSPNYYNIETNCAAKLLVQAGPEGTQRPVATPDVMALIRRQSSLGHEPFALRDGRCQWHMELVIPTSVFFADDISTFSGLRARGNLYKCGDLLSRPHFLALFPIDLPQPAFHCPQFFRPLLFE